MTEVFVVAGRRYSVEVQADRESGFRLVKIEPDDGRPGVEFRVRLLGGCGRSRTFEVDDRIEDLLFLTNGQRTLVERAGATYDVQRLRDRDRLRPADSGNEDQGRVVVRAHMPGKIVHLLREPGAEVAAGEGLVVIEAMKMQNEIKAPKSGIVVKYLAVAGSTVNSGDPLCEVE